jgi:hypothetical protein
MTMTAKRVADVVPGRRIGLFREEALERHARGGKPGRPLRSGDPVAARAVPIVLAVPLAAIVAALMLPATETVAGTVVGLARPGIVILQLPATVRAELRPGLAVEGLAGPAHLVSVESGAGGVTATAPCMASCAPGRRVAVVLGRGPVAAALVPSLRPLLEGGRS